MITLLVVDDSATTRKLVELAARRAGMSVTFAATGTEGVAQARAVAPDVILLDFMLPGLNGPEVCQQLARDSRTASIPVVMMTAKGAEVREKLRAYPAVTEILFKPFAEETLHAAVQRALSGDEQARSLNSHPALQGAKEALARALFQALRDELANIPSWETTRGDEPAGPYYAKRILTPTLMERLLKPVSPAGSANETPSTGTARARTTPSAGNAPARPAGTSPLQEKLEQLRRDPTNAPDLASDAVLARTRGFNDRVQGLHLAGDERRMLSLVDDRSDLSSLVSRSGLDAGTARAALQRLCAIDLLRPAEALEQGPVLILEPDVSGFQRSLHAWLQRRTPPLALHGFDDCADLVTGARKTKPSLVLVNDAAAGTWLEPTLKALRGIEGVAVAVVLEAPHEARAAAIASLDAADAVLAKPIAWSELEKLLEAGSPRAMAPINLSEETSDAKHTGS
jgi:CheY-like chemotaxis protein